MASIEEWSHVERWITDCFLRFNERKGEDGMMDAFPFDLRSRSAYHLPAGTMRDLTNKGDLADLLSSVGFYFGMKRPARPVD